MTKSRGILAQRRRWQEWELDWLRKYYADKRSDWVARGVHRDVRAVYAMAKKLGLTKSEAYLASPDACRLRRGDGVGAPYRFKPGQVPANKGKKGLPSVGRMSETQFKKGQVPRNHMPVGTVNTDTAGYPKVKLREPNVWGYLAQLVWASTHPWPLEPGFVLTYRDGDRGNCNPDNLVLATRGDFMRQNTVHNLPQPIKDLIVTRRVLVRKINDHEQNRRRPKRADGADEPAGSSGESRGRDRALEGDG